MMSRTMYVNGPYEGHLIIKRVDYTGILAFRKSEKMPCFRAQQVKK